MKTLKSFFIILLITLTFSVVKAEGIFEKGWTTEISDTEEYYVQGYSYEGGYIFMTPAPNKTIIELYDLSGEMIKTKIINNYYIASATYNEGYFYFLAGNEGDAYILKYDVNLNKIKEYEEELVFGAHDFFNNYVDEENTELPLIKDNKIYFLSYIENEDDEDPEEVIVTIDLDLTETTVEDFSFSYFEDEAKASEIAEEYIYLYASKGNIQAAMINTCKEKVSGGSCGTYLLIIENNELVKKIRMSNSHNYISIKIVNDYVIVDSYNYDEEVTELFVYNFKGTLVDTITIDDYYPDYMLANKNSFVVPLVSKTCYGPVDTSWRGTATQKSKDVNSFIPPVYKEQKNEQQCEVILQEYHLPLSIETKVSGEGRIDVVKTSVYGEEVTFTVTPMDGYVLSYVKVYDKLGNEIVITSNTFTMPNNDVIVEAVFMANVLNPNTKDIALVAVIILGVVGLLLSINSYRRLNWLK